MRSTTLTRDMIAIIKRARLVGYANHVIASYFVINQGRVAEVNTGQRGADVTPAGSLPSDFPAMV
jgi:hypothetical protein